MSNGMDLVQQSKDSDNWLPSYKQNKPSVAKIKCIAMYLSKTALYLESVLIELQSIEFAEMWREIKHRHLFRKQQSRPVASTRRGMFFC
jgi:hypothetical protein